MDKKGGRFDHLNHSLLLRQIERVRGPDKSIDYDKLLKFVNDTYHEHDATRKHREHTMDVMSKELGEANQVLRQRTIELKRAKDRYVLAALAANDALWEWDVETGKIYHSDRWKEMLKMAPDQEMCTIDDWYQKIHLEDINRVKSAIKKHIIEKTSRILVDYRVARTDGHYVWVTLRALADRGLEGRVIRIVGSQTDITLRKENELALKRAAFQDPLTGLPNRIVFINRLEEVIKRKRRIGTSPAAVMFVDLDRFKLVNDTLGHDVGDEVIKLVGEVLVNNVRPGDMISRLGGDEFTVLLTEIESIEEAVNIANRILERLNRRYIIHNKDIHIGASIGISIVDSPNLDAETILRNADLAMYEAKQGGRSRIEIFDFEHHKRALDGFEIQAELQEAVHDKKLRVFYQPIVDLKTGKIYGLEALVRWFHPTKGAIPPKTFIVVAEEAGLINEIGDYVLTDVLAYLQKWIKEIGYDNCPNVSVNISVRQLIDLVAYKKMYALLLKHENLMKKLCFEVTESVVMADPDEVVKRFYELKSLGLTLSIDDFGTGYSSLNYLNRFPFDILKIDQNFTATMTCDVKSYKLVKSMVGLAQDLDLQVVVEGIENEEQLAMVIAEGCEYGQGFLFAKALNEEDVEKVVHTGKVFDLAHPHTCDTNPRK